MGAWPNLFIVGAPKAGTTSLWYYLRQHPEIHMSRVKEPNYFCAQIPFAKAVRGEEAYLRLFESSPTKRFRGEASPSYMADAASPAAIHDKAPDARIVILLREPTERAYSDYWHKVRYGLERRTFLEAIHEELVTPARFPTDPSRYIHWGFYSDGIERYFATFGVNVLVLFLEKLSKSPREQTRKVLEFLGADPTFADHLKTEVRNPFSLPRNRLAAWIYRSRLGGTVGQSLVPIDFRPRLEGVLLKAGMKPEMDLEARRILDAVYKEDTARLRQLLQQPIPWLNRIA